MEKLRFALLSIVVLFVLALIGYFAVTHLQTGTQYTTNEKLTELEKENKDLTNEVASLTSELNAAQSAQPQAPAPTSTTPPPTATTPTTTTYKNQTLINALQQLITDNVTMKLKSSGTRVGTVQQFLNIYNKTSSPLDNDYGATTQKLVMNFQKDQGLTADGVASSATFTKMIAWLKKQG